MSRVGRTPIPVPDGVKVTIAVSSVKIEGPKGCLTRQVPPGIDVSLVENKVVVSVNAAHKKSAAIHGLTRSLIANMIAGVSKGFEMHLELAGIGYRAELKGKSLHLALGYSHPICFELPEGITARVDKQTQITLEGADKQLVGESAAIIRGFKKPEPYKGKGIKYTHETIKRKIGKKGIK
ncbi:MAG: 50S ribosomal protein L6 [Deltaproteobacteria bacterium]|nr:50S ribosomal protein L6 [Deltaproteobacteria bacterium]